MVNVLYGWRTSCIICERPGIARRVGISPGGHNVVGYGQVRPPVPAPHRDGCGIPEIDVASPGLTWRSRDLPRRVAVSSREPWHQGYSGALVAALECQGLSGNRWRAMASSWASVHLYGRQHIEMGVRTSSWASTVSKGSALSPEGRHCRQRVGTVARGSMASPRATWRGRQSHGMVSMDVAFSGQDNLR